ncbi:hypothetical protein CIB95_07995 [Lottiidibacillus patelloidae]|uniref:GH16 domain-containing protein n=1 Tax=Lottiidibacillus patelloidae TaxID=2670334 RepID=A0A263BV18_9BACI|nr:family 16 glycosylhydrolase [Lottiidibacillus patelloidae]OZM57392.1 hypothetical protein CIB95_07995 [Lottiidibacillus patelloidae]
MNQKLKFSMLLGFLLVIGVLIGILLFNSIGKTITENKNNLLFNSQFSNVLSTNVPDTHGVVNTEKSWIFYTNSGAEGIYELVGNVAKVTPTNIDSPPYGIQLIQSPITVEKLGVYKVSITAKTENERNITIKIGATGNKGWKAYGIKDITLTSNYETYEFEFTMYDETDTSSRFEIFFAQNEQPVWIRNVSMEKIDEEEPTITLEDLSNRVKTEIDEDKVEEWELVWADEFEGDTINLNYWTFEIGNGAEKGIPGWGNNELEYYTDSPNNAYIEDGHLIIQALKEVKNFSYDGINYTTEYTSARMITQGKVNTTYGRIEARIKVPSGQGIWPAFWMLGEDIETVGWPQSGEIDILEYIGSNVTEIHGTVHGPVTAGPGINGHIDMGIDLSKDFHVYAIEWDEDEVEFYIDDILYHIVNKDEVDLEYGPEEWVYDHDHFLILNLAVGGNWPGSPDETTIFPKQLIVDYIRMYKDVNQNSIDGEEIVDTIYELPAKAPGVESFVNGTFDEGKQDWNSYVHFDAEATFEVIDGEAVYTIAKDGGEDYSIHLYQGPFLFESGNSYTLEFEVRSTIERDLLVVVDNSDYHRYINKKVSIGESMRTVKVAIESISDEATIKLLLGELGNDIKESMTITIDNVKLYENKN